MTEALDKLIDVVEAGSWDGSWRWLLDNIWDINHCQPFSDAYHGSLDAAVALKDALLPGWMMQIIETYDGETMVNLKQKCTQHTIGGTFGPSAARALLLATLRAVKGGADAA